jgi:hypothetical protein
VPGGCASGHAAELWSASPVHGVLFGCAGSVSYANRGTLCAPGFRVATAYEWNSMLLASGTPPLHNYWTEDNLTYSGRSNSCFVGLDGSSCGPSPMRVCNSTGTDAEGNRCNWRNCGLLAATPNAYFGGCVGNATAGALCVATEGCGSPFRTQVVNSNLVGCSGRNLWDDRSQLCAAGWTAASAHQWTLAHAGAAARDSFWTNDLLGWLGNGSGSCAASLTGTSCASGTTSHEPMRLCPPSGTDSFGNLCNWTNCGLGANTPNQYFGGCVGNPTAGTLCGKADLVPIITLVQNINTETISSTSFDVVDGCITPGAHRLMRFDFHARNIGAGDAVLGAPPANTNTFSPLFVWSPQENEWHIRHFNLFTLQNVGNSSVVSTSKQSFCLEDLDKWDSNADPAKYGCTSGAVMGVTPGWEDVYETGSPCQYINMDTLGDGTYLLTAQVNTSHVVEEGDYTNNFTTRRLQIQGNTVTLF